MAGKIKPMSQIKQLLQFHKQNKSIRFIARTLGISKNTVKSYIAKLEGMKLDIDELLELEDPILEGMFHAGNPAYKDKRYEVLKLQFDYFQRELKKSELIKDYFGKNTGLPIPMVMATPSSVTIFPSKRSLAENLRPCFHMSLETIYILILPGKSFHILTNKPVR
jgi:hypothetical protein